MAIERKDAKLPDFLAPIGDPKPNPCQTSLDPFEAVEVVKQAMRLTSDRVVGRERLVEQTLLALLCREHQLLHSRTGTAKSLYAKTVFGQFDARVFSIQFTRETPEEAVFGGLDLRKFKQGTLWHRTENSIVKADFAFLDEMFDANAFILRTLLGILNERIFSKGEQQEQSPLHTAIAATNFMSETELTEPVIDRFLFQAKIDPAMPPLNELLLDQAYGRYGGRVILPKHPVPMETLRELSKIVKGENPQRVISAAFSLLFLKNQIIHRYLELATAERRKTNAQAPEIYVSPRTMAKTRDVLNAAALINHRWEVVPEDLLALRFALVTISGGDPRIQLPPEENLFLQAVSDVVAAYSRSDLDQVEALMKFNELIEAFRKGEKFEAIQALKPTPLQTILQWLGVISWQDVTEATFVSSLNGMRIDKPVIDEIRKDLIAKVQNHRE